MQDFNVLEKYEVSVDDGKVVCRQPIGEIYGDFPDGKQVVFGKIYGQTEAVIIDDVLALGKMSIKPFSKDQFITDMKLDLSKLPKWSGSKYVVCDAHTERPRVFYAQSNKRVPRKKARRILANIARAGAIQRPAAPDLNYQRTSPNNY